jgi:hypothetical protein
MATESTLADIVATIIERRCDETGVSPTSIANEAMECPELDPLKTVLRGQPLVWGGCHLQLRQIARGQLGRRFASSRKETSGTGELFKDLQWRYPTAHSAELEEPVYILRDMMSADDVAYNVARLRAEADAKSRHADALEAWHKNRK